MGSPLWRVLFVQARARRLRSVRPPAHKSFTLRRTTLTHSHSLYFLAAASFSAWYLK